MSLRKYTFCSALVVCLMCTSVSLGAVKAYLHLDGIQGEATEQGYEELIEVLGFEHSMVSPRDANSNGHPTAYRRHHEPIKIIKYIDKSTPLLMDCWNNLAPLPGFRLDFTRAGTNPLFNYYSIELLGARISAIRQVKLNADNPDNDWSREMESVYFTYDRITESYYEQGGAPIEEQANWDFEEAKVLRISDLNFDGTVNLADVAILASEWLAE